MFDNQAIMHPHVEVLLNSVLGMQFFKRRIFVDELRAGDRLEILTVLKNWYNVKVIDPENFLVEVTVDNDGCFVSERFHLIGSIVEDFPLYLENEKKNKRGKIIIIKTSAVEKVFLNGKRVLFVRKGDN